MSATRITARARHACPVWRKDGRAVIPPGMGLYRFGWRDNGELDGYDWAECLAASEQEAWAFIQPPASASGVRLEIAIHNTTGKEMVV